MKATVDIDKCELYFINASEKKEFITGQETLNNAINVRLVF